MLKYFTESGVWVAGVLADLGVPAADVSYNYRMIDYAPVSGTCQPHRDFGLLTLVQQNGVAGLMVEQGDSMVRVPGHCSLLLAGWCLHLVTNGRVPAPLHMVTTPPLRRLSCVTFLAPPKARWPIS